MSDGIMLSSTNGILWEFLKEIHTHEDATENIKEICERGIEFLAGEAL